MADDDMFEREAVALHGDAAGANGNGVGIGERPAETRLRGREDRADAGLALVIEPVEPAKPLQAGVLEITEVNHVVDVAVGIHLAPAYRQLDHHRKADEGGMNIGSSRLRYSLGRIRLRHSLSPLPALPFSLPSPPPAETTSYRNG